MAKNTTPVGSEGREPGVVSDLGRVYREHGEAAALAMLPAFLSPGTPVGWLLATAQDLEAARAWQLLVPIWCEVIQRLAADRQVSELRAYYFNDLGSFLLGSGDLRCVQCFLSALRLTRSAGRRVRTLGRLGDAYRLVHRDWARAAKFYRAAVALGDVRGYNPLHVLQARFRLTEVELNRRDLSEEFDQPRQGIEVAARHYGDLLRQTSVPSL